MRFFKPRKAIAIWRVLVAQAAIAGGWGALILVCCKLIYRFDPNELLRKIGRLFDALGRKPNAQ